MPVPERPTCGVTGQKNTATGMLVKFNRGFSSPPHIHNITYRGVVIEGLLHNDDPGAERMWLPAGSFWTQPAGESHITAADGATNLIYLEIESGPYLVLPKEDAFDNWASDRSTSTSVIWVWLTHEDVKGLEDEMVEIAHLWGRLDFTNGSFIKLRAGFEGHVHNTDGLKAVVVSGTATHQWSGSEDATELSPSSFFSSQGKGRHKLSAHSDLVLYINANGRYSIAAQE